MTQAEFYRYVEETFDSYCKTVIKHTAINIFRQLARQAEKEVSLSDLAPYSTEDTYQTYTREYNVMGHTVKIHDYTIGEALQYIQPRLRDVILLRYYLDYSDTEIAKMLRISNTTVKNRMNAALRKMKQQIENMKDI